MLFLVPRSSVFRVLYQTCFARIQLDLSLDGTVNHSPIRAVEQPVSNVRVWPNPVQDQLTFEQLPEEDVQLEVRDLNGRLIYQTQLQEKRGVIPTASWRAGVYQLRLRVNGRLHYNDRIIKF